VERERETRLICGLFGGLGVLALAAVAAVVTA
jgi:hypothetical protein